MCAKISVAMAAYQGERYLPVQLDSILSQLGPQDEVVVSYDRSMDGTLQVLEAYRQKDPRVKIFYNERPGITGNFNNAIANCTGDYIYISDQDDQWVSGKVEAVQACFAAEKVDLVIHNGVHVDNDLQPVSEPFFTIFRIGNGKLKNLIKPRYSGCCMAFTRRLQKILLPMPEIKAYDHWIGMVGECFGRIGYVDKVLLLHRLHGGNATTPRRKMSVIIKTRSKLVWCLLYRRLRKGKRS